MLFSVGVFWFESVCQFFEDVGWEEEMELSVEALAGDWFDTTFSAGGASLADEV